MNMQDTQFKKGHTPWNKGMTGLQIGNKKGTKFTDEHRENLSLSHRGVRLNRRRPVEISTCKNCLIAFEHKNPPSRPRVYCSLICQRKYALEAGRTREYPIGNKHPNWKGDKARYHALHDWIEKTLGKPSECENCGITEAKRFEWANISGKYKRDIADWARLCSHCHHLFDNIAVRGWNTRHAAI